MGGLESLTATGGLSLFKVVDVLSKVGAVLILMVVIAILAYLAIYYLNYNKKVLLIFQTGGGLRFAVDKGKADTKKKEFKLLKYRKLEISYPSSDNEYPWGRGTVLPYVVKNQQAAPICGISANPHFIPADINMFHHLISRLKRNYELTRPKVTFWDKYGKDIMVMSILTIFFISLIFILKRVDKAIEMGKGWTSIAETKARQTITNGVVMPILFTVKKWKENR